MNKNEFYKVKTGWPSEFSDSHALKMWVLEVYYKL